MACPPPVGGLTSLAHPPEADNRVTLRLGPDMREAPMTLVINVVIYAAIVLVPLGMAFLFIRLGRIFSSR